MKDSSTVTFILTPSRDGSTHLRLGHKGLEGDSGKIMYPLFKGGWGLKLGSQLGLAIAGLAKKRAR